MEKGVVTRSFWDCRILIWRRKSEYELFVYEDGKRWQESLLESRLMDSESSKQC